jgi:hypothetical protein
MVGFQGGGFDSGQGDALDYQNIITGSGVCQQVERDIFQRAPNADAAHEQLVFAENLDDLGVE